ncbi:MAG: hypothetical protein ABWY16_12820 [Pedobacter sp.]|uniref:hypothetical protein n=1 Tax=Pedobacter sp. TaxID=1411316 RepID=UPI00339AFFE9
MENYTEKDEQVQPNTPDTTKQKDTATEETNGSEHQQVDEEGNEVKPEDIK